MVRLWDGFDCGKRKFKMSRGHVQRTCITLSFHFLALDVFATVA